MTTCFKFSNNLYFFTKINIIYNILLALQQFFYLFFDLIKSFFFVNYHLYHIFLKNECKLIYENFLAMFSATTKFEHISRKTIHFPTNCFANFFSGCDDSPDKRNNSASERNMNWLFIFLNLLKTSEKVSQYIFRSCLFGQVPLDQSYSINYRLEITLYFFLYQSAVKSFHLPTTPLDKVVLCIFLRVNIILLIIFILFPLCHLK